MRNTNKLVNIIGRRMISLFILFFLFLIIFSIYSAEKEKKEDFTFHCSLFTSLLEKGIFTPDKFSDQEAINTIFNTDVDNVSYISSEGRILYSSNRFYEGKHTYQIPEVGKYIVFKNREATYSLTAAKENNRRFYVNTEIIEDDEGIVDGYLFVKIKAGNLIGDNIKSSWGFILIFVILAIDIIPFMLRIIKIKIISRLNVIAQDYQEVSEGNLNINIEKDPGGDEVSVLKNDFISIVQNLKKTSEFANEIEKQNFDFEYKPLSDQDQLSMALLKLRDNLKDTLNEEEKRKQKDKLANWATQGVAKFAEILRQDNDNVEKLGLNIISNLVSYLGANQAGFFLVSDEKNENGEFYIDLKASFAYNREKFLNTRIEWGIGTLGNCIQEGKSLYLTNIPDNYINITSGLGDSNPRCLFIVPLIANNTTYGAIEIASFTEFEQYQLDFVNRLSESIASTIATVNINMQTSELLASTKEQSERIMQQEEEMRQNMEELQATQEEMERKQEQIKKLAQELIQEEIEMREFIEKIKKF